MKNRSKLFEITERIADNRWFPSVYLPIAFFFVLIYSYTTSPLFVDEGMDSCVFKTMGLAILQGKTPYVDLFDHKGPVLYFINAFGQFLIPGRTGIFCLQIVWMFCILLLLDKVAKLFLRSDLSFLVVLMSLLALSGIYQEGNQCEEWELLPVVMGLYLALRFILKPHSHSLVRYSFIWGLCFGFIFFIRPNDAVSQVGGVMGGIILFLMKEKDVGAIFKSVSAFATSVLIVSIPILLFFSSKNAVPDLIYGMIYHNALYSEGIKQMIVSSFSPSKLCFFSLFVPIGCMAANSGYRNILYILSPLFILSLLLTGNNLFYHYFIVLIPALLLLFWSFLLKQNSLTVVVMSLSMLYLCSYGSQINFIRRAREETMFRLKNIKRGDTAIRNFYNETEKLINLIPLAERNSVWNYNLMWKDLPEFSILYHNGIVQCNLVPFYPMCIVDNNLRDLDDICKHKPKWIIVSHSYDSLYDFSSGYDYIKHNYSLAGECDYWMCKIELYHTTTAITYNYDCSQERGMWMHHTSSGDNGYGKLSCFSVLEYPKRGTFTGHVNIALREGLKIK